MKFKVALIFLVLIFIQSCIPSIHQLWTQDKIVFEPDLLGAWGQTEADEPDFWFFSGGFDEEAKQATGYELIHKDGKALAKFKVYLVKLGEHLFFDIFPDELKYLKFENQTLGVPQNYFPGNSNDEQADIPLNSLYFQHLLPVHTFAKVEIEKDEVKIFRFDMDWLEDLFKQRKIRIKHEISSDDQIVLTAPTEDLQKFLKSMPMTRRHTSIRLFCIVPNNIK